MTEMKDSGAREEFTSGAVRDTSDNKPRPDLISPFAKERIGYWLMLGARKYKPWNWAKGIPMSRIVESLERHLMAFQQGLEDEDHLAAIMCNAMFLLDHDERIKQGLLPAEFNDMISFGDFSECSKST